MDKGTSSAPSILAEFDRLPSAALVRRPIVEALYSCSTSTLRRRVADGRIPKPHRYSDRVTAWNVGELREALKAKPAIVIEGATPTPKQSLQDLRAKRAALEAQMREGFDAELSRELDACVALEDEATEGQ